MVEYSKGPNGYGRYQDWFTTRKVGAANHGVPDLEEELEGLIEDIENTNWDGLNDWETTQVANVAIDATRMICQVESYEGNIDAKTGYSIMFHISSKLIHEIMGVDNPFGEAGLKMSLASSVDDLDME